MAHNHNIIQPFFETATANPEALALSVGKRDVSYGELAQHAAKLAGYLSTHLETRRIGILGSRSFAAYIGVVGAAWAGATYVPLNTKWPEDRLVTLMTDLELDALVIDETGAKLMTDAVKDAAPDCTIACNPDQAIDGFDNLIDMQVTSLDAPAMRSAEDLGYIVFTSGSTGMPKGVMVSCGSLAEYLFETDKWAQFTPSDRIAEAHNITFDLSVHNMFLAFGAGSSIHLMSELDLMAPQAFIRRRDITVWMSVPTIVNNMRRAGRLKPDLFPTLRQSVFCGEPLAMATVEAWQEAAPNSVIENIYGPTECTVVCMRQRYTNPPLVTKERGILSIGDAYANFDITICDENGVPVADGTIGEIVLASSQLSNGYFNAPDLTAKAFREHHGVMHYYTGDLGYRDTDGKYHHMGRVDNQVKMKGNRIELEEVETHLRQVCDTELAVVVGWPVIEGSVQGLVGFTTNLEMTEQDVKKGMGKQLPDYMIPARIEFRAELPRNINDKIDRKALVAELDSVIEAPSMETPDPQRQTERT